MSWFHLPEPHPRPGIIVRVDEENSCHLEGAADDLDGGTPRLAYTRLELMHRDDADPGLSGQLPLAPAEKTTGSAALGWGYGHP